MPLTPIQENIRRQIYRQLDPFPVPPGSPLYEPIYENEALSSGEDPVKLMKIRIEYSDLNSIQLFSGFRGCGKTTELLRLRDSLSQSGYFVLYMDLLDYINPAEPVDITDLLLVLAGAFSDTLEPKLPGPLGTDSYWERFRHFLTDTQVLAGDVTLQAQVMNVKTSLKTTPTFRQRLQEVLAGRLGALKESVDQFFLDGIQRIHDKFGPNAHVVLIYDSLEQIRGTRFNMDSVIQSVVQLFAQNYNMLILPNVHVVYSVPPWLRFAYPGIPNIQMLPNVRLWKNDPSRNQDKSGWKAFRSLLHRRFTVDGIDYFNDFFGASTKGGSNRVADRLIGQCGGHFRDMLQLARAALLRTESLPIPLSTVDHAIRIVREGFLPIPLNDARWLEKISKFRDVALGDTSYDSVDRLTRFLDTHLVVCFANGQTWYDIHPPNSGGSGSDRHRNRLED